MFIAGLVLLASAQGLAGTHLVDPMMVFLHTPVILPTRRPAVRDLDEVFEQAPRIDPDRVLLDNTTPTADVTGEVVAIVAAGCRPVDLEVGHGRSEVHLDEIECAPFAEGAFLEQAIACRGPVVVDMPWSSDASGWRTFLTVGGSGRVVDADGRPVAEIELHLASLAASGAPSSLDSFATTGADGTWEREALQTSVTRDLSAPRPAPRAQYLALRSHASHAWQVFPNVAGSTISLGEPALLSVYLVDENGEPVEGSELRLGPATIVAPGLLDLPGPVAPDPEVVMRDRGGWEIPGLPRGVYRVYARAPGHAPAAALIDLSSGHRELMLTLPRAELFSVSVLDADGEPARGVRATVAVPGSDVSLDGAMTDAIGGAIGAATGVLVLDRAPAAGPLVLRAEHPQLGSAQITWEGGPREVTLRLSGEPLPPRTTGTWGALYDRLFAE